jgi:uncharacterized glyoxalase superfamily protein PhnB
MKLTSLRPMIWVDNVEQTIEWYVSELGFEEINYAEEWQWGLVKKDEVCLMMAKPDEHTSYNGPQFTGSFYFNTDNVDEWWDKLKNSPYIFYGLENFEYGMREFAIKDCNGYILQFGQELLDEEDR